MQQIPDVSVIIATYRRPAELTEAIQSALGQLDATVEVIVVDDCPDGSARAAVSAIGDDRVTYRRMARPSGGLPGLVRNSAWPHARGRFVHFLDDDDLLPPGQYAAAVRAFAEHQNSGVVVSGIQPFGDDEAAVRDERRYFGLAEQRLAGSRRFGGQWAVAATMLFHAAPFVCSAALVRRECIGPVGGFDPAIKSIEDIDFYARAIRRFGAVFTDRVGLYRRVHASLIRQPQAKQEILASYSRMRDNYRKQWGAFDYYAMKAFARTVLRAF